jgi:hypothetical protein
MEKENFFVAVCEFFKSKGVELSKILLQKAMYALDFAKEDTGFQFEAYHYGPFSKGLGELLAELRGDDKIKIDDNIITFPEQSLMNREIPPSVTKKVEKILLPFWDEVLERRADFDSVELKGTVMYVMDVLEIEKGDGVIPPLDEVRESVKRWKRQKFSDAEIKRAYDCIREHMWALREESA